jgi:hypothetical protein
LFYVSTSDQPSATPGLLDLSNVTPGSTGMLHVWVNSDVRLSGVSLDLMSSGNGIKFVGPQTVNGQGTAWAFLDGPQSVSDNLVTRFGGGAVPGSSGNGVGGDSPTGANFLLGSVGYMALPGPAGQSQLSLRVAGNEIVDWAGGYPQLRFGNASAAPLTGDQVGQSGGVGTIDLGGGVQAPVITDATLGPLATDTANAITHQFAADQPITTWTLMSLLGPAGATPTVAPSLSATGAFSWAATKADLRGLDSAQWVATVTGQNANGSDTGTLTINLVIPEPATLSLVGLAMIGLVGLVRRRS